MADIVRLKGEHPVLSHKEAMLARFEEHVTTLRQWLQNCEAGGFALFGYDMMQGEDGPTLHTWAQTFVHNPGDSFWLPDAAKTRIYQRIHGDDE